MNAKVTVDGMTVNTKVQNNLLITEDALTSTAKKADSLFDTSLTQTVTGIIEPVSTVDGVNFFYTAASNVKGDGDAKEDTYVAYVEGDDFDSNYGFNTASSTECYGYKDYVFQLKATNTDAANAAALKLTKLDLTYAGSTDLNKAFRVAIFVEDITTVTPTGTVGSLKAIYSPSGATNHTNGKAVKSTTALDTVTYATAAVDLASVASNSTAYYKVVVRLWIEGEDSTCTNETFASLNLNWSFDLAFELGTTTAAVYNINMKATS